MENIACASLLYLSNAGSVNLNAKSQHKNIEILVRNANLLAKSLEPSSIRLTVFTNDELGLLTLINSLYPAGVDFSIRAIQFTLPIPKNLKFAAAHFKLEAYLHASRYLDNAYVIFLDLDVVALRDIKPLLDKDRSALCYDITDQVSPAYGSKQISDDLSKVSGQPQPAQWFGGEFLAGERSFFEILDVEIRKNFFKYLELSNQLHHVGDEFLTSLAILEVRKSVTIRDGGKAMFVNRMWSGHTLHKQTPIWKVLTATAFLHLPQEKDFLAQYESRMTNGSKFNKTNFLIKLAWRLTWRRCGSWIAHFIRSTK